jgi:hypothetical protein
VVESLAEGHDLVIDDAHCEATKPRLFGRAKRPELVHDLVVRSRADESVADSGSEFRRPRSCRSNLDQEE